MDFFISVNSIAMSFSVTGSGAAGAAGSVVGDSCITDWITIPCATNTNSPTAQSGTPTVCVDRICGMVFNSVTQPSGTASVPVNSKSQGIWEKKLLRPFVLVLRAQMLLAHRVMFILTCRQKFEHCRLGSGLQQMMPEFLISCPFKV